MPAVQELQIFTLPPYVSMEGYNWLLCFLSVRPVVDISATVAPIGVKFCTMVHLGPGQIVSHFAGGTPAIPNPNFGPKFGHLTASISKTVSRSVTCRLEFDVSSTKAFWKCKSRHSRRRGVHPPVRWVCILLTHVSNCKYIASYRELLPSEADMRWLPLSVLWNRSPTSTVSVINKFQRSHCLDNACLRESLRRRPPRSR